MIEHGYVSNIQPLGVVVTPKKKRLIHDERHTNSYQTIPELSYDHIQDISNGITHNDFLGSIDISHAYTHVHLRDNICQYFGLQWKDHTYRFAAMPFGWCQAPYLFTILLNPAVRWLRSPYIICAKYLDDLAFRTPASSHAYDRHSLTMWLVVTLLTKLDFVLSLHKCVLSPTTILEFLGTVINSSSLTFELSAEKRTHLRQTIYDILQSQSVSLHDIHSIASKIVSRHHIFPGTHLFTRNLFHTLSLSSDQFDRVTLGQAAPVKNSSTGSIPLALILPPSYYANLSHPLSM